MPVEIKTRRPVKKFVARRFSDKRVKRMQGIGHYNTLVLKTNSNKIFKTAEKFFEFQNPRNSKLIFVGQGMRPLFEAVRGINEFRQVFKRKDVRYIVASGILYPEALTDQLLKKGISPKNRKTIYVIDYRFHGRTYESVKRAIKSINPAAKVVEVNQKTEQFSPGINTADIMARSTSKGSSARLFRLVPGSYEKRTAHLIFQKNLQEYLDAIKKR